MKILSDEVKRVLRKNYVTGNHGDDENLVCETEEKFTDRVTREIIQQVRELLDEGEWTFSLETYRWLKFLLAEFKHRPTIGDVSDIDWEAHFAKEICERMGNEAIQTIKALLEE